MKKRNFKAYRSKGEKGWRVTFRHPDGKLTTRGLSTTEKEVADEIVKDLHELCELHEVIESKDFDEVLPSLSKFHSTALSAYLGAKNKYLLEMVLNFKKRSVSENIAAFIAGQIQIQIAHAEHRRSAFLALYGKEHAEFDQRLLAILKIWYVLKDGLIQSKVRTVRKGRDLALEAQRASVLLSKDLPAYNKSLYDSLGTDLSLFESVLNYLKSSS